MRSKAQRAGGVLRRWDRSNSRAAQQKLVNGDPWRLWRLARDLAEALRELTDDRGAELQKIADHGGAADAAIRGERGAR